MNAFVNFYAKLQLCEQDIKFLCIFVSDMSKKTKQKRVPVQAPKVERVETKRNNIHFPLWLLPIIYSVVFVIFAWIFLVGKNADTLYYMQDRGRWNDVLCEFYSAKGNPTRMMVLYRDIALLNRGEFQSY